MATLELGKVYLPENAAVIRDDLLTDFRLEAISAGVEEPSVQPGTDNWFWATAQANASMLQYANIQTVRPAITPLTATGQDLEDWRIALGLPVVGASGASGKLTASVAPGATVTVPNGQQFVLPNGLRGQASGTQPGIADGDPVSVIMIDTGERTNADSGTKVRWVSPPFNLLTEARVSSDEPLTGGFDAETEARKRERVLNRLATSAGGGNWGQLREIALNTLPSVQDAYVYPAAGGPSSCKVVIVRAFDVARNDYQRSMSDAAVTLVANAIHAQMADGQEIPIETVAEESADVALYLELPSSSLAGGNGLGWLDQSPWPTTDADTPITVTTVTSSNVVTIDATDAAEPIDGLHHVSWWAPGDQKFYTALITDHSGSAGAWVLTLDTPLVDSDGTSVAVGDYISPAAVNAESYGSTFVSLMGALGAGENVEPDASDTPRRFRHPFITDGAQISITSKMLLDLRRAHSEIEEASFAHLPTSTPTVPSTVDDPPNILVPRHFGIQVAP